MNYGGVPQYGKRFFDVTINWRTRLCALGLFYINGGLGQGGVWRFEVEPCSKLNPSTSLWKAINHAAN